MPRMARQKPLTLSQQAFLHHYIENGFNASRAYQTTHKGCSQDTAAANGSRMLSLARVKAELDKRLAKHWKSLQMDGEEALARVAMDAKADPRDLFDEHGHPLAPHQWPAHMANSIESFEIKDNQTIKVKLASKSAARKVILDVTGKLKNPLAEAAGNLARILAGDFKPEDDS